MSCSPPLEGAIRAIAVDDECVDGDAAPRWPAPGLIIPRRTPRWPDRGDGQVASIRKLALFFLSSWPDRGDGQVASIRKLALFFLSSPAGVPDGFEMRTDHGPQYTGETCAEFSKDWKVNHTFAPVGRPTGNAVAERVIRTIKEECIWLRDWVSLKELEAALTVWQSEYNERRPHQSLHWSTPSERRQERLGSTMRLAA